MKNMVGVTMEKYEKKMEKRRRTKLKLFDGCCSSVSSDLFAQTPFLP